MDGEAQLKFTRSYKKVCNFVKKCKKLGLSTKITDTDPITKIQRFFSTGHLLFQEEGGEFLILKTLKCTPSLRQIKNFDINKLYQSIYFLKQLII